MDTMFVYYFIDPYLGDEISLKKREQQKKGVLKYRIETPLHNCIGASRKFHAESACFVIVFLW